jgi:hypothetical protein
MSDIDITFENIYDPINENPTKKLLNKQKSGSNFNFLCNDIYNCLFSCCFFL